MRAAVVAGVGDPGRYWKSTGVTSGIADPGYNDEAERNTINEHYQK